ncbi:hypothetical protein H9X96_12970 [Pedobacter sp. N36a]|uniref:hypothetical protein n=1 Tax=Pedobacter sp. N36a TaxID=2767996 RepID=UPI00165739B1|nr:hypothetical protein [Pedobacter sp. N36a]MBC8986689.1 hypothetical protein [Pedobacter sp. N36a]
MVITDFDLPSDNIGEITLIGTAGGYGESIVIHLGNQNWAVVDSCKDPLNGQCLPLEYLKSIGVNVKEQVKLLVCTHWHNDHIKGLSTLFGICESARLCFAPCSDTEKFLLFVNLEQLKATSNQSTTEFAKCLEINELRGSPIMRAGPDRNLLTLNNGNSESKIYSLSPSDATLTAYDYEISTLINSIGPLGKIIAEGPNAKSVALSVNLGKHSAILGADLEISGNKYEGWTNILDNSTVINKKRQTSLLKISHHGSSNGYDARIWNELLKENAVGKLTPYNKSKLPRAEMVKVYTDHTQNLYSTSNNDSDSKTKKRDRSIEKAIKEYRPSLTELRYTKGILRSRIEIDNEDAEWKTDTYGPAFHINAS